MLVQSSVVRPASVSTPSFDLCLSHSFFPPLLSLLSSSQSSNNSPGLTLTLFLISTFCLLFSLWKPSPRVLPAHTVHSHTSLLLYRSSSFSISRDRALFPHLLSSPCSCLPCYLCLSCFCILAHLPSFCLWLFCKLPHFLSLCLIPSFSFLSVLSALEATQVRQCYQSQHYLTTFSGSTSSVILSRLPIACWFCCPPCLLASAALTFSHKLSTHANTHPLILQTTHDYMLHPACLRGSLPPSSLFLSSLPSFI